MKELILKLGKQLNDKMYFIALREYEGYLKWKLENPNEDDEVYFDFVKNCCLEKLIK